MSKDQQARSMAADMEMEYLRRRPVNPSPLEDLALIYEVGNERLRASLKPTLRQRVLRRLGL